MNRPVRLMLVAGVSGIGLAAGGVALASRAQPCDLPIYTDGGQHYVGVCVGDAYVQLNETSGALAGDTPLVEAQTGIEGADALLWGDGEHSYGPAGVWIGPGPASNRPSCAPEGDDRYGYSNGNNVTRELPTVYTDGLAHHVGICGGTGGYVQLNETFGALAGDNALLEGQSGNETVDSKVWGNGQDSYGPATLWIAGGGPAGTKPSCAPAGDDRYVHANGNNVTRELPTVYTDGATRVGICGGDESGGGRIEAQVTDDPKGVLRIEAAIPLPPL